MEANRGISLLTLINAGSGTSFMVNVTTLPLARVRDWVSTNPVDDGEGTVGDDREMSRGMEDDISKSDVKELWQAMAGKLPVVAVSELEEVSALAPAQLMGTLPGCAYASRLAGNNMEKWQGRHVVAGMGGGNGEVIAGMEDGSGDGADETEAPNCPPSCATNPRTLTCSFLVLDVDAKMRRPMPSTICAGGLYGNCLM